MLDLLPPKYVILYHEADQLKKDGQYAAAEAKREEAAAAKSAAIEPIERQREERVSPSAPPPKVDKSGWRRLTRAQRRRMPKA